jgi:hypothetical protein
MVLRRKHRYGTFLVQNQCLDNDFFHVEDLPKNGESLKF